MRMHPILHYLRMHDGDDIGGKCGQPIYAAQSGVVVKAEMGYNGGSGNNIRINHGDINGVNVETAYLHMTSYVVAVGQKVDKGTLVGHVGSTGLSTACHLHFSLYKNGRGSDPMEYIGWNPEANKNGAPYTDAPTEG
jgi:murein DD-endopeptidase MepM/ murein hydrolase activator NlpD